MSSGFEASARRTGIMKRIFAIKEVGIFLILLLMVLSLSVTTSSFATFSNAVSILQAISPVALMAIGQTFVILTAGIDLSVGSVCALSAYFMALVLTGEAGHSLWLGIAAALGTGTLCGLFSGFLITKVRVTPFIVTLGMLSACSGLTLGLSGGKQIGLNKFGQSIEVTDSILSPSGEVSGKPTVARRFYCESNETTAIAFSSESGVWIGASDPGHVYHLDEEWQETVGCPLESEFVHALAAIADGAVLAGGSPGGKIWRIARDGSSSLFFDTGAEAVLGLLRDQEGSTWVATRGPGELVHLDETGAVQWRVPVADAEAVTSFAPGPKDSVLVATNQPGVVARIDRSGKASILYRSDLSGVHCVKTDGEGGIFFLEGEEEPDRLMALRGKRAVEIWKTPKPPIRDFLLFPKGVIVVSTGNMGALYLSKEREEPSMLHSMTQFKARVLVRSGPDHPLLVGNAGPGGLSTVTTETTKTMYPVAESFNNLYQWAPVTMIALVVLASLFLRFTTYGTYLYAIGGNETAARLSGINTDRMKIFAYALTGFLAGLASVFMTSKLHTLDPNLAKGYELKVIAAVVIGGTSLMGGEGTVWGTLIGACLLFVMNYALVHLGMEDIWSDLFVGGIIIIAAVIDSTRSRFPAMIAFFRRRS